MVVPFDSRQLTIDREHRRLIDCKRCLLEISEVRRCTDLVHGCMPVLEGRSTFWPFSCQQWVAINTWLKLPFDRWLCWTILSDRMAGVFWYTADGSDQSKLLEYSRLYYPGVPDVETEDLETTNIKYLMRANVSETYWTAVRADTSQHLECHVVCQSGMSVTVIVNNSHIRSRTAFNVFLHQGT